MYKLVQLCSQYMRDENNPFEDENVETITMDDMMSEGEKVLFELLYLPEPETVGELAEKTNVDASTVGDIARSLVNSGYLVSDSGSIGLTGETSVYTDPIVSDLIKQVKTFRAADSKEEITEAIHTHREAITELEEETGFESEKEFNNALFDEDESPELSDTNRNKDMKWIVVKEQLETLKTVREKYEEFEAKNEMLDEFGFTPVSINPPSHDKRRHLEPVVDSPPF